MKKQTMFSNADLGLGLVPDAGAGLLVPNRICLANENRFTSAFFSEPLTTFAVGWQDPTDVMAMLDALFPAVQVPRKFEFKNATNSEAFLSETDDTRAIGAAFKMVEYKAASALGQTLNKGLTIRLDRDEMTDGDEEKAIQRLMARLNRNDLRRGLALILANDNNTAKTWDGSTGKDPDSDVISEVITSGDARGIDANIVVYGQTAWQKRFLSLSNMTAPALGVRANLQADAVAGVLGVNKVVISKERYQSSTSAKSKIVGSYVLVYQADQNAGKDDASNVKRFWTPTESGRFRVYRQEFAKSVELSVEHYSNIVVTSTLGIRTLTIS